MLTISNSLSFVRIPLAFVFMLESPYLRFIAVVLAMLTDSIDGYLARRSRSVSRFGAILDPVTDKFFVYFALTILFLEGRLLLWQALVMLSRDICLCLYGLWVVAIGRWHSVVIQSIRWGKVTTALQFIILSGLIFHFSFSWIAYGAFVVMGVFAFLELLRSQSRALTN